MKKFGKNIIMAIFMMIFASLMFFTTLGVTLIIFACGYPTVALIYGILLCCLWLAASATFFESKTYTFICRWIEE